MVLLVVGWVVCGSGLSPPAGLRAVPSAAGPRENEGFERIGRAVEHQASEDRAEHERPRERIVARRDRGGDRLAESRNRAAEILGTTPAFLRAIGEARLITPLRSEGGHRRYSRYQLKIAARARELDDQGTPVEAACRIIILEDQLEEAQRLNAEYRRTAGSANPDTAA